MTDVKPQDHWTVVGAIKAARALIKAADDLSFAAQITGGTAGRDEALCLAVIHWAAERDKQKQVLRIIELEGHDPEVGVGYELCPMPKPQADHSEDILHMVTPRDRALRPAQSPPKQSELYPMPTNPDLAALSAAATPGPWRYRPMPYDDWGVVKSSPIDGYSYVLAQFRDPRRDDEETLNQHRRDKTDPWGDNAQFVCAIVNAYRTGNLIQIDREGMRALHERIVSRPHDAPMHIEHLLDDADAAIAAILGGE